MFKTLETFIRLFPKVIRAVADNPLGVVALIVLVISLVTMVLFYGKRKGVLAAFVIFVVALTVLAFRVIAVYPEVKRTNAEQDFGPQSYNLETDTTWSAPIINVRDGTVVNTNGHNFAIDAKNRLTVAGHMIIRSFREDAAPAAPPEKSPAPRAPDLPEAPRCQPGRQGNPGIAGEVGEPGATGSIAGRVSIIAPTATGSIKVINTGMNGGSGGKGGDGGVGGTGQRGGRGRQNYVAHIPTDCACGGSFGGAGGPGGDAGPGGLGGLGGRGGDISLKIEKPNALTLAVDDRGGLSGPDGLAGRPGDSGQGGPGGGGDGPACRDESNSRRGANGTQLGHVPPTRNRPPLRAQPGVLAADSTLQVHVTSD
jgi:hypothetical protein